MTDIIKHRALIFVVSLALFMESLDANILNTAIPSMAKSLAVNPIDLKIALIGYLLSLAIFIPVSGWAADKYGAKKLFLSAIIIFSLSSLWCGFTTSLPELVIARVFQGLGGSMMLPVARLILLRTVGKNQLIVAMGRVIMVSALGIMLGPVLGGIITHYWSWRWIFWINIPVGLFTFILGCYLLKPTQKLSVAKLDKIGFALFGLGLAGFTFALSAFSETTLKDSTAILILTGACLFLFGYFWHSRHSKNPIIQPALFYSRVFRIASAGNLTTRIGFAGTPFLIPLLLQIGLGYSAPVSGALLIPMALGVILVKKPTANLLRIFGYKYLLLLNTMLISSFLFSFSLLTIHTPLAVIATIIFFFGMVTSIQYGCMNSLAYGCIEQSHYSAATSFISILQQLGNSLGVAASALFLRFFSLNSGSHFSLTPTVFHHSFIAMSSLTLCSILIFMRLLAQDGNDLYR